MPETLSSQATCEEPKEDVPSLEFSQSAELFGEEMDEYPEEERTSSPSVDSTTFSLGVVKTEDETQETNNVSSQESLDKIDSLPLKTSPRPIADESSTLDLTQEDVCIIKHNKFIFKMFYKY